jgi:alginate O-acetyltransferase complex protein AlgI
MVFSSAFFTTVFLPIVIASYALCPALIRKYLLLLFSLVFYAWGAPVFIMFLVGSCALDYLLSLRLHGAKRKQILALSIVLNVGLLGYFKYANFFVGNTNWLLQEMGLAPMPWAEVALPIGISFFTFQKISYMLDIYRGSAAPVKRFGDFLLYITLFPQLIAGPIIRFSDLRDQVARPRIYAPHSERLEGVFRFCFGLAKKVLIANTMAAESDRIMALPADELSTTTAWLGILAFAFQIYFDFSGYSDMAIGLGKMLGFHFPENFNFPYMARSITEFWQRWHITLGTWMRDYLYIPLGGNRKSGRRTLFNLATVFLISGLWHGASWSFVIWGAWHGLLLVLERAFLKRWLDKLPAAVSVLWTFGLVLLGWVFFAMDAEPGWDFMGRLFAFDDGLTTEPGNRFYATLVLAIVGSVWAFSPHLQVAAKKAFTQAAHAPALMRLLVFVLCIGLLLLSEAEMMAEGFNPFIYYRF